ncbi:hypothetical protein GLOTRDRAFT_134520 [Gloeophyllum trabeum ATCC 11539]|uniref:Uncharacterized protein n=1 Tax=Gloeophyllum trabeum (strain ATCC 11539 / FP-39264 / Madison 617) TaxID=670483 RepID=S7PPQ9_GLOTA|nr:uncharacterized protein GLOTRDRAFT_134520 [Gloeophyllum trabeum ATCC 11539]EPQ49866.1 hypothetical protein GLOTRDRAFT_134520 [Gloeophyllum trabeum ATCC 11539]
MSARRSASGRATAATAAAAAVRNANSGGRQSVWVVGTRLCPDARVRALSGAGERGIQGRCVMFLYSRGVRNTNHGCGALSLDVGAKGAIGEGDGGGNGSSGGRGSGRRPLALPTGYRGWGMSVEGGGGVVRGRREVGSEQVGRRVQKMKYNVDEGERLLRSPVADVLALIGARNGRLPVGKRPGEAGREG